MSASIAMLLLVSNHISILIIFDKYQNQVQNFNIVIPFEQFETFQSLSLMVYDAISNMIILLLLI